MSLSFFIVFVFYHGRKEAFIRKEIQKPLLVTATLEMRSTIHKSLLRKLIYTLEMRSTIHKSLLRKLIYTTVMAVREIPGKI